jgi:hypothetical protein
MGTDPNRANSFGQPPGKTPFPAAVAPILDGLYRAFAGGVTPTLLFRQPGPVATSPRMLTSALWLSSTEQSISSGITISSVPAACGDAICSRDPSTRKMPTERGQSCLPNAFLNWKKGCEGEAFQRFRSHDPDLLNPILFLGLALNRPFIDDNKRTQLLRSSLKIGRLLDGELAQYWHGAVVGIRRGRKG